MKGIKGAPMKGAIVHGALLVVMLVYGYKVWTRDKSADSAAVGTVVLWNKPESELIAIEYAAPNRTVKLEKRGEGASGYWWGLETKETPPPPPAPPSPGPMAPAPGDGAGSAAKPGTGSGSAAMKPGAGSAAKPGAGSAAVKPGAGSAAMKPGAGSATMKPAAGSAAKPAAGSAAKPPAPKPAAGSAAPGPSKMADPDLVAYAPGGGSAAPGAGSAAAKPKAPTAGAGSGSAAKPAPKAPTTGAGSGSATAKAPATGTGSGSAAAKAPTAGAGSGSASAGSGSAAEASTPAPTPDDPLGAAALGIDKPAPITTTREFPVGDGADKVIKGLTAARALRDLGKITDEQKKEYKLDDTSTTLSVVFRSGTRSFVVGGSVYGGADKYVLDTDSGKAYVLAGTLLSPLEQGESGLRLTDPRGFDATTISKVTVTAAGKARTAARITVDAAAKPDPANPHAPPAGKTKTWGDPVSGKPDQTLANFIDNADRLKPTKYEASLDPKTMTEVVKLTYQDSKGATLGTVTLYKRDKTPDNVPDKANPPPAVTEYYVMTEKTRVPGLVPKSAAERVDQDVATVFPQ